MGFENLQRFCANVSARQPKRTYTLSTSVSNAYRNYCPILGIKVLTNTLGSGFASRYQVITITFNPFIDTAKTNYYYMIATEQWSNSQCNSGTSIISGKIAVYSPTMEITPANQPIATSNYCNTETNINNLSDFSNCVVNTEDATIQYQWYRQSGLAQNLSTDTKIIGATNSSLTRVSSPFG